jgi:hypothetical protein
MKGIKGPMGEMRIPLKPNARPVKQLHTVLGHTGYYRKFIKGYAQITMPMEKLLKKDCQYSWIEES